MIAYSDTRDHKRKKMWVTLKKEVVPRKEEVVMLIKSAFNLAGHSLLVYTDELLELWRVWTSLLEACEAGGGPPPELLRAGHPWARGQAMLDAGFCVRNS